MNLKNYFLLILFIISLNFFDSKSQTWTNISSAWIASQNMQQGTTSYNIGCGGVVANRLTGDVTIKFTLYGMWRTSDNGKTFVRIDQNTVGGRNETAWAIQGDQADPKRMAVFSLDGTAAYTTDGTTWKKWTTRGRNWDLGAVNWDSPSPKVIFAARHEYNSVLELSKDGGVTWAPLSVTANMGNTSEGVMLGVIDSSTLIYSNNNGINRSTDLGVTWTKVSSAVTRCKVATMFKGVCYVGTTKGLLVSTDKGVTWNIQGSSIDIVQGPQFGADENSMVIVNTTGMYKSTDAGTTWKLVSGLTYGTGQYSIHDVTIFGSYVWEPIHNIFYATAISNPAFKCETDTINPTAPTNVTAANITATGCTVSWTASTDNVGVVLYEIFQSGISIGTSATTSIKVNGLNPSTLYTITVKAKDSGGNYSLSGSVIVTTTKDTENPSPPTKITATNITSTGCTVSWTKSTDNVGVETYVIYKSGDSIGTSATTSFNITGLCPESLYQILVKAKDAAGNSSLNSGIVVTTKSSSLNPLELYLGISVYPNPASDYVLIDIPENISGSVIIYNASGIIVADTKIQSNPVRIDVSAFPKGIYLARFASDQECMTRSFLIQ